LYVSIEKVKHKLKHEKCALAYLLQTCMRLIGIKFCFRFIPGASAG